MERLFCNHCVKLVCFVICPGLACAVVQFHQRALAEQEKLDMGQLDKSQKLSTVFQAKTEQAALLAVAQKRLVLLEKWFLPIFSALIAGYQIAIGLYLLNFLSVETLAFEEQKQPFVCAIFMAAIAFVSFLMSRYATGMSASEDVPVWKPLRAGGSFLLASAILCFILAIALTVAAYFRNFILIDITGWVIAGLLIVIGIEIALNVILDIYRPRIKGVYSRSAFDSRLLGIINEPTAILRTAAGAIDYQFGFKVSQTWFYKLLEKAIVPLLLFAAVVLYLVSTAVVIAPDEQAVIEHFGNPLDSSGKPRVAGPGLIFKWPWPIDIAYKYPTNKIMELSIGFVPKAYKENERREPLLWGKSHYAKEEMLLVASESRQTGGGAVPVSLVIATVPVQYKVKDVYSFIYTNNEPNKLLEAICYEELTKFAASATIEVDNQVDIGRSLLGAGRGDAEKTISDRVQKAADKAGLGIEIVFLGLQGIHPPPEVAAEYEKVIGSVQTKQALVLNADAESNMILSNLVGSVADANTLYNLAARYQQARREGNAEQTEKLGKELDTTFAAAKGDIFKTLRQAQSYAYEKVTLAEATGQRFAGQIMAYRASPEFYRREQLLNVYENSMSNIRKYVIVSDKNNTEIFEIDLKEKLTPSLYDVGGVEETSTK